VTSGWSRAYSLAR